MKSRRLQEKVVLISCCALVTAFAARADDGWTWEKDTVKVTVVESEGSNWGYVPGVKWDLAARYDARFFDGDTALGFALSTAGRVQDYAHENAEALTADMFTFFHFATDWIKADDCPAWLGPTDVSLNDPELSIGMRSSIETDQSFDEALVVSGASLKLLNPNPETLLAILPETRINLDAVRRFESAAREGLGLDEDDESLRVSGEAIWQLSPGFLPYCDWLSWLTVNARWRYSREYHTDRAWENAHLDESSSWDLEANVEISEIINVRRYGVLVPASLILGWSEGRTAPAVQEESVFYGALQWDGRTLFGRKGA